MLSLINLTQGAIFLLPSDAITHFEALQGVVVSNIILTALSSLAMSALFYSNFRTFYFSLSPRVIRPLKLKVKLLSMMLSLYLLFALLSYSLWLEGSLLDFCLYFLEAIKNFSLFNLVMECLMRRKFLFPILGLLAFIACSLSLFQWLCFDFSNNVSYYLAFFPVFSLIFCYSSYRPSPALPWLIPCEFLFFACLYSTLLCKLLQPRTKSHSMG